MSHSESRSSVTVTWSGLSAFSSITNLDTLVVVDNNALTDLSGFASLESASLEIYRNSSLSYCEICTLLSHFTTKNRQMTPHSKIGRKS